MAVFTPVSPDEARAFIDGYDLGGLTAIAPIAEGVQNTNFRLETGAGRKVLTLFEGAPDDDDLRFCLGLTDHLAGRGFPAARVERDRQGRRLGKLNGRSAAVVDWVEGHGLLHPTPADHHTAGAALARLHLAAADYTATRIDPMGPDAWVSLLARCQAATADLASDHPDRAMTLALRPILDRALALRTGGLPSGPIHADYFPDNVLFTGGAVSGVIDFYFGCTGPLAWDLATALNAWTFDAVGARDDIAHAAFLDGYNTVRPLMPAETAALPALGAASALRFTLTRLHDRLHHDPAWLVTPKDPQPFFRRIGVWETS